MGLSFNICSVVFYLFLLSFDQRSFTKHSAFCLVFRSSQRGYFLMDVLMGMMVMMSVFFMVSFSCIQLRHVFLTSQTYLEDLQRVKQDIHRSWVHDREGSLSLRSYQHGACVFVVFQ